MWGEAPSDVANETKPNCELISPHPKILLDFDFDFDFDFDSGIVVVKTRVVAAPTLQKSYQFVNSTRREKRRKQE